MIIENLNKEYTIDNNLCYSCQYLVVFCTKYQRKFINDEIKTFIEKVFYDTANEFGFKIHSLEILNNQVSLIISCNPKFGIDTAITKLKNNSSSLLKKEYPYLSKKVPSIWTRNYFISTMGNVNVEDINKFVSTQKNI